MINNSQQIFEGEDMHYFNQRNPICPCPDQSKSAVVRFSQGMNRKMAAQHNCRRNFYYIELMDSIVSQDQPKEHLHLGLIRAQRAKTRDLLFDAGAECVGKFHTQEESITELIELAEFYKFYLQPPLIYDKKLFHLMEDYHEKKKDSLYRILKTKFGLNLSLSFSSTLESMNQSSGSSQNTTLKNSPFQKFSIMKFIQSPRATSKALDESECLRQLNSSLVRTFGKPAYHSLEQIDLRYKFKIGRSLKPNKIKQKNSQKQKIEKVQQNSQKMKRLQNQVPGDRKHQVYGRLLSFKSKDVHKYSQGNYTENLNKPSRFTSSGKFKPISIMNFQETLQLPHEIKMHENNTLLKNNSAPKLRSSESSGLSKKVVLANSQPASRNSMHLGKHYDGNTESMPKSRLQIFEFKQFKKSIEFHKEKIRSQVREMILKNQIHKEDSAAHTRMHGSRRPQNKRVDLLSRDKQPYRCGDRAINSK